VLSVVESLVDVDVLVQINAVWDVYQCNQTDARSLREWFAGAFVPLARRLIEGLIDEPPPPSVVNPGVSVGPAKALMK
jgi:hypothetical protein